MCYISKVNKKLNLRGILTIMLLMTTIFSKSLTDTIRISSDSIMGDFML
jgi:hypothetical protein